MSLILAHSFNENDSTNIRDYSNSLNNGGTATGLTPTADTFGYYMDLNGSTSKWTIPAPLMGDSHSYFFEFFTDSVAGIQFISYRNTHSTIKLSSNNLIYTVDNGTSTTIVQLRGVTISTWYKICCTFDGTTAKIYVDNNSVEDSKGGTSSGLSDANVINVGYDGSTNYYNGRLREFRIYDTTLGTDAIAALMDTQQGIVCGTSNHPFNVGDLITQTDKNNTRADATVFATDTNEVRLLPMSTYQIQGGLDLVRCGHRWDTDRQHYFVLDGSTASPEISVFDGVTLHSDLDSDTAKKIIVNKNGIYKGSITKTANYTVTNKDLRIFVDSSGGAFTLTLPSSPTTNKELEIIDSVGSCSTYNVTIDGNGNNILGSTNIPMSTNYEGFHLSWNGTQWLLG